MRPSGLVISLKMAEFLPIVRSMRSMRGGFIFRNRGPSLKVHHCQHLASVTKHVCYHLLRLWARGGDGLFKASRMIVQLW
jgi:hypothetical protein